MAKKTIRDVDVKGKRVLMRVDFNVPMQDGAITDDKRIRAALPTIQHVIKEGGKVILMSHLGRPKGKPDDAFRLDPVAQRLSELLGQPVQKVDDCIGPEVEKAVAGLEPGDVLLLENVRFYAAETENDPEFAKALAALGDIFVNDAFGTAHRAHASTTGVADYLPRSPASSWRRNCSSWAVRWKIPSGPSWPSWAAPRSKTRSRSSSRC